jgi:hypothetical protein
MEGLLLFVEEKLEVEHVPRMLAERLFGSGSTSPSQGDISLESADFSAT